MDIDALKNRNFESELSFSASRSSGPGGQNVNKVNTKIELRFSIPNSLLLSEKEKTILLLKPSSHLLNNGELIFVSQEHRSQLRNKEQAIENFYSYTSKALTPKKKRKKTKPSKSSVERRLQKKKQLAELKQRRKKPHSKLSSWN